MEWKGRLQCAPGGTLNSGFFVFGDTADDGSLVKCGLRFKMRKAVIVERNTCPKNRPPAPALA